MARMFGGLVEFQIEEFKGKVCKTCMGGGGLRKPEGIVTCDKCEGTGLVNRTVDSTVKFKVQPFSYGQKIEILKFQTMNAGQMVTDTIRQSGEAIRMAVKEVTGLFTDEAGQVPYKLEFVEGKQDMGLTEKCLSDLMNTKLTRGLAAGCNALLAGIPDEITDTMGNVIPGTKVILDGKGQIPN